MTQSVGNTVSPELFISEITDKYLQRNFRNLAKFFKEENQFLGFRFVEVVTTGAVTEGRIAHGLSYLPKDLLRLSVTGAGSITWLYSQFTLTQLAYTTTGSIRVRLMVGSYRLDASPNDFDIDDIEVWKSQDVDTDSGAIVSTTSIADDFLVNVGLSVTTVTGAMTVKLKQADGETDLTEASPVELAFRLLDITKGGYTRQQFVDPHLNFTVPSGAKLGFVNLEPAVVFVYLIYTEKYKEMAVSAFRFSEATLHNTTALSTGSDSGTVLYSTNARTNCAIRLIGMITIDTNTTAGTWTTPTTVSVNKTTLTHLKYLDSIDYSCITRNASLNQVVLGASSWQRWELDAEDYDPRGMHSTVDGRITIKKAGTYLLLCHVHTDAVNIETAGDRAIIALYKNGVAHGYVDFQEVDDPNSGKQWHLQGQIVVHAIYGDYYDIRGFVDDSNTTTVNSTRSTMFAAIFIKGRRGGQ